MKLTYKSFEHRTKILDPFYRDPGYSNVLSHRTSLFVKNRDSQNDS